MPDSNHVEDKAQRGSLKEFAPRVREILRNYRDKRKLKMVAEEAGINPTRLTEMISTDENGNHKRNITPYYLAKFIDSGIMSVEEILDGQRLSDIPVKPRLFLERMILSRKTINLVVEAQQRGIDVDRLLEIVLAQGNK
jgi:hypothetical protein